MRTSLRLLLLVLLILGLTATVQAQATRTWVSGVGDDANPCSRTAPCKTFAGAISKTAAGGEISVLDPGGYGAVTITKSLMIDGTGTKASILNSGTTGVIVNAAATDRIYLRGIDINGAGTVSPGLNGIRIIQAREVTLEDVVISNQQAAAPNGRGILANPTTGFVKVNLINVTIRNCAVHGFASEPTAPGQVQSYLDNVRLVQNGGSGFRLAVAGHTVWRDVETMSNGDAGLLIEAGEAYVWHSTLTANAHGIRATGGTTRVGLSAVVNNSTNGINLAGGTVNTHGNNAVAGNSGNQTFSGVSLGTQ